MAVGKIIRHLDEIYKRDRLGADTARRGDYAEVVRDHCAARETGLLVRVVNDPHSSEQFCAFCGQKIVGYFVEVEAPELSATGVPGPYFYPVDWLRRFDPRLNRPAR